MRVFLVLILAACGTVETTAPPRPDPLRALQECLATAARDIYRAGAWDQERYDARARACYLTYWP